MSASGESIEFRDDHKWEEDFPSFVYEREDAGCVADVAVGVKEEGCVFDLELGMVGVVMGMGMGWSEEGWVGGGLVGVEIAEEGGVEGEGRAGVVFPVEEVEGSVNTNTFLDTSSSFLKLRGSTEGHVKKCVNVLRIFLGVNFHTGHYGTRDGVHFGDVLSDPLVKETIDSVLRTVRNYKYEPLSAPKLEVVTVSRAIALSSLDFHAPRPKPLARLLGVASYFLALCGALRRGEVGPIQLAGLELPINPDTNAIWLDADGFPKFLRVLVPETKGSCAYYIHINRANTRIFDTVLYLCALKYTLVKFNETLEPGAKKVKYLFCKITNEIPAVGELGRISVDDESARWATTQRVANLVMEGPDGQPILNAAGLAIVLYTYHSLRHSFVFWAAVTLLYHLATNVAGDSVRLVCETIKAAGRWSTTSSFKRYIDHAGHQIHLLILHKTRHPLLDHFLWSDPMPIKVTRAQQGLDLNLSGGQRRRHAAIHGQGLTVMTAESLSQGRITGSLQMATEAVFVSYLKELYDGKYRGKVELGFLNATEPFIGFQQSQSQPRPFPMPQQQQQQQQTAQMAQLPEQQSQILSLQQQQLQHQPIQPPLKLQQLSFDLQQHLSLPQHPFPLSPSHTHQQIPLQPQQLPPHSQQALQSSALQWLELLPSEPHTSSSPSPFPNAASPFGQFDAFSDVDVSAFTSQTPFQAFPAPSCALPSTTGSASSVLAAPLNVHHSLLQLEFSNGTQQRFSLMPASTLAPSLLSVDPVPLSGPSLRTVAPVSAITPPQFPEFTLSFSGRPETPHVPFAVTLPYKNCPFGLKNLAISEVIETVNGALFRDWVEKFESSATSKLFFDGNRTNAGKAYRKLLALEYVFAHDFSGRLASWNSFFSTKNKALFSPVDVDKLRELFAAAREADLSQTDVIPCSTIHDAHLGGLRSSGILSKAPVRKRAKTS
ncbi:hypothetical protein HDU98_008475 [Podochytrium sp. JEL0797]|nr:hypothetical protein HDU98_008475 [Podochytrium sp. JEL0797]